MIMQYMAMGIVIAEKLNVHNLAACCADGFQQPTIATNAPSSYIHYKTINKN